MGMSGLRRRGRAAVSVLATALLVTGGLIVPTTASSATEPVCTGNAIVCENLKPGTPASVWDAQLGAGDPTIQGFGTQMSINHGETIDFKIKTDAAYTIDIYRIGWYQGNGARRLDTIEYSEITPHPAQPACADDKVTEIYDCGTWGVSASWAVPTDAVSGVYFARLIRTDNGGASQIPFIVRNDGSTSDVVFQTSDTTWQAYNTYGGSSFYQGISNGRAYKLSYNRPFVTRGVSLGRDYLFSNEYPTIRFMEQNGYDVSYISGLDSHLNGASLLNHKAFMAVGHDEYWSGPQRQNVTAARDAGVNLAFLTGNEVYWKVRWEPSQDGTNTPNRTLVCYKDTWANLQIDPVEPTPTWRDPRFGDLGGGPENGLLGNLYMANNSDLPITVSEQEGKLRLWRHTDLAAQASGGSTELARHTVGYESNEDIDNGFRPAGTIRLSTTTGPTPEYLTDYGNTVVPGTTTHHLTQYRADSGALVFGAGTIQWGWGLDAKHDGPAEPADPRMRQATVNLLADMEVLPQTLDAALTSATQSTDDTEPAAAISSPLNGALLTQGQLVTVTGTATDVGGRVGGVEVSLDGGRRWHPATGTYDFSYTGVLGGTGPDAIQARAVDDSGNIQSEPGTAAVNSECPCSLLGAAVPSNPAASDSSAVTVGMRFTAEENGFVTAIRFYKGTGNTGTHVGSLFTATGHQLSRVTFVDESPTGWQTAQLPSAVPVTAGTQYIVAYFAPSGHYAADTAYFGLAGRSVGALSAPGGPGNQNNGLFSGGDTVPDKSYRATNYWVDVVWSATDTTPLTAATITPAADASSVLTTSPVRAQLSRDVDAESVTFTVADDAHALVPGSVAYDGSTRQITFTPGAALTAGTRYTARLTATAPGVGPMAAPLVWSFTTARAPLSPGLCPCTLFPETEHPTSGPSQDASVELGLAFSAATAGSVTGVRFYKDPADSGNGSVSLWDNVGARIATAPVPAGTPSGWQEVAFAAPVEIVVGQGYTASYRNVSGRYSWAAGALASPRTVDPLHTPERAGRYTYGSGAPGNTSTTNYLVDPVFQRAPEAAPTVLAVDPAAGATSVPVGSAVTITFSGPVQATTVAVELKDQSGTVVAGAVAGESSWPTITFVPTDNLRPSTTYTFRVLAAIGSGGTPLATPWTGTFTTAGGGTCPCTLVPGGTVPTLIDAGDAGPISLGTRFTTAVAGQALGVRFYAAAANTGPHTGSLYGPDGLRKATVVFPAVTAPGWQQATFDVPVDLTVGVEYTVATFMPAGHYSAAGRFFDVAWTNPPLTATAGLYKYGEDSRPTGSYGNTFYYVDVVFSTTQVTVPTVAAQVPAVGATGVPVSAAVSATFARPVDAGTVGLAVKGPDGQPIAGAGSYDPASRTVTFTPASVLPFGTTLTAAVQASSEAGVAMPAFTWTFTTVATPPDGMSVSLFDNAAAPATAAWPDPDAVTLGVRFSTTAHAFVTGIRFWAGEGNTGSQVTLWNGIGDEVATASVVGNTGSGWRTAFFASPVPVVGGSEYIASYRAPAGRYAVTSGGLSSSVVSGPLSSASPGAVYTYGSGVPGSTSATNYWVDVLVVVPPTAPEGRQAPLQSTPVRQPDAAAAVAEEQSDSPTPQDPPGPDTITADSSDSAEGN